VKYGLIPEFIGRLPIVAVLDPLEEQALIDILVKPKNALTKQYQKLFGYEKVELKFTEGALKAVARQALIRKTGARGLRGVLESSMMDIMFEIPSKENVKEVIIDEEVVNLHVKPKMVYRTEKEIADLQISSAKKDSKDSAESA
jgi:ATP-dependent Clp protease ATP-binding subunit ClpX